MKHKFRKGDTARATMVEENILSTCVDPDTLSRSTVTITVWPEDEFEVLSEQDEFLLVDCKIIKDGLIYTFKAHVNYIELVSEGPAALLEWIDLL